MQCSFSSRQRTVQSGMGDAANAHYEVSWLFQYAGLPQTHRVTCFGYPDTSGVYPQRDRKVATRATLLDRPQMSVCGLYTEVSGTRFK